MKLFCEHCQKIFPVTDPGNEAECPSCGKKSPRPESLTAPGVVLGDFLILRPITSGGMGEIFVARQLSLDREVALKVLQEKFSQDPESAESLLHEARAAAKLNHPNIVQAYAVGREDGVLFFAMELIRGETCKDLLKRKKRLDGYDAAKIILDVARALDAAWSEQKIVHQDIKPENIMLDASGFAKLADLGLARRAGSDPECNSEEVMGTPQYISPEQLTGVPTDVRSDIYSLGATFYHLVTGRFPYVAPTTDEITQMHVEGKLQPPIEVYDHLNEELNRIILKMMARNIEERYQSPQELISDLEAFIRGEVVATTRSVKVRRPWSRRKKWIVFGGGAAVLLFLCIALFVTGCVFAASPQMPEFARGFFSQCRLQEEKGIAALKKFFTPKEKPPVPKAKPVEYAGREALFRSGKSLLARLKSGENSMALLEDADAFFRKYASPETEKERKLLLEVSAATGRCDEMLRQSPARQQSLMRYQRQADEIAARREAEKERAREFQRRQREQAEAEKRRQQEWAREQQEKARAEQALLAGKIAEFNAALQKSAQQLLLDFIECAKSGDTARFEKKLSRLVDLPPQISYKDVKSGADLFDRYRQSLRQIFPEYIRFLEQMKNLPQLGISVSLPGHGICYVLAVDSSRMGRFRTIRGSEFDFPLDEYHRAETMRFLNVFGRSLGWQSPKNPAAFYYALYCGRLTPGAVELAPDDFWRKFGEPLKLTLPSP